MEEVFRLKVKRKRRDTRKGTVWRANVKVREKLVRRILATMFHEPFASFKPDWLRNPKTNRRLEIDCFSERLKLCVEVDGIHHHDSRSHYHKSHDEFLRLRWRDQLKTRLCAEHGYRLVRVPPSTVLPDADLEVYLMTQLARVL